MWQITSSTMNLPIQFATMVTVRTDNVEEVILLLSIITSNPRVLTVNLSSTGQFFD